MQCANKSSNFVSVNCEGGFMKSFDVLQSTWSSVNIAPIIIMLHTYNLHTWVRPLLRFMCNYIISVLSDISYIPYTCFLTQEMRYPRTMSANFLFLLLPVFSCHHRCIKHVTCYAKFMETFFNKLLSLAGPTHFSGNSQIIHLSELIAGTMATSGTQRFNGN